MERTVPVLPVDDLRVAKDFYAGKLGFTVTWEWSDDGINGLIGVERDTIAITLDCPMAGHGRNVCVSLHVESADAYSLERRGRGVEIQRPPANQEWGGRTFGVTDPFGNTIFVIGPIEAAIPTT
jgi:uncharacterized glyoxalase superfamily protein PhnB